MTNGTSGDDNLRGTSGEDNFDLSQGGNDTVRGLASNDQFDFGDTFGSDRVFGGSGTDAILLSGDYNVSLSANAMSSVEVMLFNGAFDFQIQFADENIAAHQQLFISGAGIAAGHHMVIFGEFETDGHFNIQGSAGDDYLSLGAGNDFAFGNDGSDEIYAGFGEDTVNGGAGVDYIAFTGDHALDAGDRVDGGDTDSINTIYLSGDYSSGLTLNAHTIANIERIILLSGSDYSLNIGHAALPTNFASVVDGQGLNSGDHMHIDGSGARNYDGYHFLGGAADDVLIGAKGGDAFTGSQGADTMTGNGGFDVFIYNAAADSTGKHYDTITDFDGLSSYLEVQAALPPLTHIEAVDASVKHGELSTASFDHDLHHAINANRLDVHHTVLFTPDSGSLAGELFLIVDINGQAGYQAGEDIVVHLEHARHLADFDAENFDPHT